MTLFRSSKYNSLVGPILEEAKINPEKPAMIFVENDESEEIVTIGQLFSEAAAFSGTLKEAGLKQGDIVIIALRHCKELISTFWGVLFTGAVPSIFAYKGPMSTYESYIKRLKDVIYHSGAQLVVTLPEVKEALKKNRVETDCPVLTVERGEVRDRNGRTMPHLHFTSGEQLAYLQYTSGTTGMQKGVELSHWAILNFIESFARTLQIGDNDVVVNWLPLYHDFGLFAGHILPLICGIPAVLISPFQWLRNPKILPWTIHKHNGTISFLPNSAHNHIVRSVPEQKFEGLNLTSLRILINAAEPILYNSQNLFLERFAPYGFRETALVTGYGMAENTLPVTLSPIGERSPVDWVCAKEMQTLKQAIPAPADREKSIANVSSGTPIEGVEVEIVDENRCRLLERYMGEIIIRSNFLFSGYHKRPDLTEQVMNNGWYFTGDLGYIAAGQLYVCGRKKDLIIVGGSNIHPEDIEAVAGLVPGIYEGSVVSFGILDEDIGTEKIVLICGLERPVSETEKVDIERRLRRKIFNELEVTLGGVHLVKKNWVVKTHNGKIARGLNREKYLKELAIK